VELEFQAITSDQANVYFKSMLLYSVQNANEETIKKVAFKFISEKDMMSALIDGGRNHPHVCGFLPSGEILACAKSCGIRNRSAVDNSLEDGAITC
jgi:hypothetical protein